MLDAVDIAITGPAPAPRRNFVVAGALGGDHASLWEPRGEGRHARPEAAPYKALKRLEAEADARLV